MELQVKRIRLLILTSSDNLNQITVFGSAYRQQAVGEKSRLNDGGCTLCTQDTQHATLTRFLPSVFGFGGVGPGTGGGDVRIWDGAILHPQGVTTLSWRGGERRKEGVRRRGERDRHQAVSHVLMSMEIRSRRKLIFPLECQQSSLVTEDNSVMSSLGKTSGLGTS